VFTGSQFYSLTLEFIVSIWYNHRVCDFCFYEEAKKTNLKNLTGIFALRGKGLSGRAKTTYLQEKIKEARKSERSGIVISILGSVLVVFSFSFPIMIKLMYASPAFLAFFFVGIIGGILAIILGLVIGIYYAVEGGILMRQQKIGEDNPDMP